MPSMLSSLIEISSHTFPLKIIAKITKNDLVKIRNLLFEHAQLNKKDNNLVLLKIPFYTFNLP